MPGPLRFWAQALCQTGQRSADGGSVTSASWKARARYLGVLEEVLKGITGLLQLIAPTTHLIPDSTPLVDLYDMEAKWGYTHEGPFRGFKLHTIVNQMGLPLKALSARATHSLGVS